MPLWFGDNKRDKDAMALQVWFRELLSNTQDFLPVLHQIARIKVPWLLRLFHEYTGFDIHDMRLYNAILSLLSPCFMMTISRYFPLDEKNEVVAFLRDPRFVDNLKLFAFAGLDALCKK